MKIGDTSCLESLDTIFFVLITRHEHCAGHENVAKSG